jgi:hypothetical protein
MLRASRGKNTEGTEKRKKQRREKRTPRAQSLRTSGQRHFEAPLEDRGKQGKQELTVP